MPCDKGGKKGNGKKGGKKGSGKSGMSGMMK